MRWESDPINAPPSRGSRNLWILGPGALKGVLLGPALRLVQMARLACSSGHEAVLAMEDGEEGVFEEFRTCKLTTSLVQQIQPGDPVIAVATLHPRLLKALLDAGLAFDLDLYGLGALEHMEMDHPYTDRQVFQSRRRLRRRYRILVEHAECIYLSNSKQLTFLGGSLFADGTRAACKLASRIPEKTLLLPMGVPRHDATPFATPYPESFTGRPVFLWGGGIWSWFDIETLLFAFKILKDRGSPAALYFICGANPSGIPSHDVPVRRAYQMAADLGLMPGTVAFHERGVSGGDLPAYLQHCAAGIMSNPEHLESTASWRTRLLDALAFGKPIITAGFDPLSAHLESRGAALVAPPKAPLRLADHIDEFCQNMELRQSLESASRRVAQELSWEAIFAPWLERLRNPESFRMRRFRPGWIQQIRFALGI